MEKFIDLTKTQTVLINLDSQKERLHRSTKLLISLNISFDRFKAIKRPKGVLGCGLSHLNILSRVTSPTLILEDDIEKTDYIKTNFHVPEAADAVYLGISNHGYVRKQPIGFRGVVLATQVTPVWKRVFNMCSTHAILYLSEKYIDAARERIATCIEKGVAFDVGLAALHRHFNILTPNDPWFYQTEQPQFTNLSLET